MIIADIIAKEERLKCHMMKQFCDQSGSTNLTEMWKKKKMAQGTIFPPCCQNKSHRKVSLYRSDTKKTMIKEYEERLRPQPLHPMMKKQYKMKNIQMKLLLAKDNKSPEISMKELEDVLKTTKVGKARDPEGMVREILKPNVIGDDLKLSLLYLLNLVKAQGEFPEFMRRANISTIPKKTKSRLHLKNPAYGRQSISRPMRIVAPIPQ